MSFKIEKGLFKFDITDHHAVLGLPLGADTKQVRKRYLKVARTLHPDSCRDKSEAEKEKASEILSKLVNPAYEFLSKDNSRSEYQLVLSQTGKRLATEGGKVTLYSSGAKELSKAGGPSLDTVYQTSLKALASEQYKSLGEVIDKIAQLSELNMVYLMKKGGAGVRRNAPSGASTSTAKKGSNAQNADANTKPISQTSPVDTYIRRAQEYIAKKNFAKAILELRDGLKLDANNVSCNSLLGLAYLQQKQVGMAKVYIGKALKLDPQDANALKGKQWLEKLSGGETTSKKTSSSKSTSSKSGKSGGGMFGGLFGGKKK